LERVNEKSPKEVEDSPVGRYQCSWWWFRRWCWLRWI